MKEKIEKVIKQYEHIITDMKTYSISALQKDEVFKATRYAVQIETFMRVISDLKSILKENEK